MPPNLEQIFEAFIIRVPPALRSDGQAGALHRDACCSEPLPENALTDDAVVLDVVNC
jgi:hypothetical protein